MSKLLRFQLFVVVLILVVGTTFVHYNKHRDVGEPITNLPYPNGSICYVANDIDFRIIRSYQNITDEWYYDIEYTGDNNGSYEGLSHDMIEFCETTDDGGLEWD